MVKIDPSSEVRLNVAHPASSAETVRVPVISMYDVLI